MSHFALTVFCRAPHQPPSHTRVNPARERRIAADVLGEHVAARHFLASIQPRGRRRGLQREIPDVAVASLMKSAMAKPLLESSCM